MTEDEMEQAVTEAFAAVCNREDAVKPTARLEAMRIVAKWIDGGCQFEDRPSGGISVLCWGSKHNSTLAHQAAFGSADAMTDLFEEVLSDHKWALNSGGWAEVFSSGAPLFFEATTARAATPSRALLSATLKAMMAKEGQA